MQKKSDQPPRFSIGKIAMTRGVMRELPLDEVKESLARHRSADWGTVCPEDWESNDQSLECGSRLLSSYRSSDGTVFWIITEADRSVTTVLLPSEY